MSKRILAIDPAIKDMGWAVIDVAIRGSAVTMTHVDSGVLSQNLTSTPANILLAIDNTRIFAYELIKQHRPDHIVIEEPEIFASGKGLAALHSGSVSKLVAVVHSIRTLALCLNALPQPTYPQSIGGVPHPLSLVQQSHKAPKPHLVKVRQWKGNTPKSITQQRVRRDLGVSFKDHNQMDAIGIARYFAKKLLAKQNQYQ